jgi:phospholipid/cholesterol/gamma-HCH transport system substrate-binding protein
VSQQAISFTEVTDGVQQATDRIGSAADQARATLERVDGFLADERLASTFDDLAVITQNLRGLSEDLDGTNDDLRRVAIRADSAFVRADAILARLNEGEGTLGRFVQDPAMADELTTMVTELRVLLVDIRENPRRYLRLSIF